MAVTAYATGTQSTSVGTEHFLSSPNAAGFYQLVVDLNAAAAGDVFELRTHAICLTGGTVREENLVVVPHDKIGDQKIYRSIPIPNDLTDTSSLRFSLKQTLGSSRSVPWKVLTW